MIVARPIWDNEHVAKDPFSAFVIMPFREKWSSYIYSDYISLSLQAAGLAPMRADEMYGRNVLTDIWRGIYACRLVIADVSAPNENVFYELGIAHTLGKKTILLTQNTDRVPFDLRHQRMVVYTDDHPGYEVLKRELPRHIEAILAEPIDEIHRITSIMGGYLITRACVQIMLDPHDPTSAHMIDSMDVVATRENVVLTNKVLEFPGRITSLSCNHRFVRSTEYPDVVRVAALFDPPYLQVGDRTSIDFEYRVEHGFADDHRIAPYDVAVDTEELVLELVAPVSYSGTARLVRIAKPTEYMLERLTPDARDDGKHFRGTIPRPETNTTYAIAWG